MGWKDAPLYTPTKAPAKPKSASWRDAPEAGNEPSWLDVGLEAVQNIPSSAIEFGKGIAETVTHPVRTVSSLLDIAAGGLQRGAEKVLPKKAYDFIQSLDSNPAAAQRAVRAADAAGGFYRQRYGSVEALKRTLAKDPVGAAADLSTLVSGGAGLARGGAKVAARVSPTVSNAMARSAAAAERVAAATNPVNVLAPAAAKFARGAANVPVAAMKYASPKKAAYLEAAEGKGPQIVEALRSPNAMLVEGTRPTAAQVAAPVGATKFAALGESAAKVLPSEYTARAEQNAAARLAGIRRVGGTAETLKGAETAREAATAPLYAAAEREVFKADPALMQMADDPYIREAMPDAVKLSKSQGVDFRSNPVKFLHNVKISLDKMLTRTGDTALARGERSQVLDVRNRLLGWLEEKAPAYGEARQTYAAKSKPINQMQVGQYLEGKLTGALGDTAPERATVFATAVKDAAGTLKKATTNEARFKALTDVLTPEQAAIVYSIRDDLAREATAKRYASAAAGASPKAEQLASSALRGVRPPRLLNRITALAGDLISRLEGKIDRKMAIQLATEMIDPETAAAALEKAMKAEQTARRTGRRVRGALETAGRIAKSPEVVGATQIQNAMAQQ